MRERHPFSGSPKCFSVVFSLDSKRIASGHFNSTTLIWDAPVSPRVPRGPSDLLPERLDTLWQDEAKAYQAIGALVMAPKQAVPFIRKHVCM
jgi:hypothetical protein